MSTRPQVILDTDTYNEVDDQFALAHLLLAPDLIDLVAVYAAPFYNDRSEGPEDGMERSYREIHKVYELLQPERAPATFRGSRGYLPAAQTPVPSDAAADLVARAEALGEGERLQVVAIGAITNVASALLLAPQIAPRLQVTWLGGHAPYWHHTNEFNLKQDLHAARVFLETEVDFILVPCWPVASHLLTTVAELEARLAPCGKFGAYLSDIVRDYGANRPGWAKEIWDLGATAYVLNPEWLLLEEQPAPVLRDDLTWEAGSNRRTIKIARRVFRDEIFGDFYERLRLHAERLGKVGH
ncbi:MAG: nucleoside hydrolase [Verrucomicrobiota bacterium]